VSESGVYRIPEEEHREPSGGWGGDKASRSQ
jgi:hypothetical protein